MLRSPLAFAVVSLIVGCSSSASSPSSSCVDPPSSCSITLSLVSAPSTFCGPAGFSESGTFDPHAGESSFIDPAGQQCTQSTSGCTIDRQCMGPYGDAGNVAVDASYSFDGHGGVTGTTTVTGEGQTCKYSVTGTGC
jgi:hypothetical protein